MVGVAGTRSGSGKTLLALALMEHYRRRGTTVQPFKVGPDHIDPLFHRAWTDRPSPALDGVYADPGEMSRIVARFGTGAGVGVVEGVMGFFDGREGASGTTGSTAEVFGSLGIPYVLVTDGRGRSQSVAAELKGYLDSKPDLTCLGVVVNHLYGERHRRLVEGALARRLDVPVLGCLEHREGLQVPTRHLGLHSGELQDRVRTLRDRVRDTLLPALNLERAPLPAARSVPPGGPPGGTDRQEETVTIGLARDRAFQFYYPENLRRLRAAGAELRPVSPCRDERLPEDLDGLYLGGGYPEEHAGILSENRSFMQDLRERLAEGLPVLAECGGLMYLGRSLARDGETRRMAGWFPLEVEMTERPAALGYVRGTTRRESPLGPAGTSLVGHEFHYSRVRASDSLEPILDLEEGSGLGRGRDGLVRGNVWGSYAHLYFGTTPQLASRWVELCRRGRAGVMCPG